MVKDRSVTQEELERLYQEIANGDEEAFRFVIAWQLYCHGIDDIVDGDEKSSEGIVAVFFTSCELYNSNFWLRHGRELHILVPVITNDYADSNSQNKKITKEQKDFLRSTGNNMLLAVSYITGGYPLMRKLSPKIREMSFREHHDTITLEGI